MTRNRRRYGDTFSVPLGPRTDVVFLSDPAAAAEVFGGPPEDMDMGDINGLFRRVLGRNSLLVLDGDEHMRQRRLLLPPFHGERIARHRDSMIRAAEEDVATWPIGKPFALQPRMQAMTLNVILRAVFGLDDGARRDGLRAVLARAGEQIDRYTRELHQLGLDTTEREVRWLNELIRSEQQAAHGLRPGDEAGPTENTTENTTENSQHQDTSGE